MDPISKPIKTIYMKNGRMKMRFKENKFSENQRKHTFNRWAV